MVEIQGLDGFLDPIDSCSYTLDCGDVTETLMIGFTRFTMPRASREVFDYFSGGNMGSIVRKIPGAKVTHEPIEIEKALVPIDQLDNLKGWWDSVCNIDYKGLMARTYRRTCKFYLKDNTGTVQRTITIFNAFPSEFVPGSDGDGGTSSASVERLTIQFEGFKVGGALGISLPFSNPL